LSNLSVSPATFQMASTETLPLAFNTAALLSGAETPSSPSSVLTDLTTGSAYAAGLSGSPSVVSNTITQTVTALRAGRRYRLAVTFQAAAGKVWTMELLIECLF
jgi:hypothetical protein